MELSPALLAGIVLLCLAAGALFALIPVHFLLKKNSRRAESEAVQLAEARERAEAANAAKSDFLANMSHEIRTPINAVLGMNEMIIRESSEEPIVHYARNVERAGKNLLAVINDILDFSRIESGSLVLHPEPYSLSSVINDVSNLILFRAKDKELRFSAKVDPKIPDRLLGDEMRVRQILTNLLSNAVKYTNEGSVTLEVGMPRPEDDDRQILLSFKVTDTGIGIRPEDMERLFRKFERFDMKRNNTIEGAGLGLAITKNLLDLMGGDITVDSRYGRGSVFCATFPQRVVDPAPVGDFEETFRRLMQEQAPYRVSYTAPSARLLVVDDTQINLTVIKKLLGETRMQIDTATSGLQALSMTQDVPYDLILMDQRMPAMDGAETLAHIRRQAGGVNQHTPVICLTADAVGDAKERYVQMGFDDYLSKPVDSAAAEKMIRRYLPAEKIMETSGEGSFGARGSASADSAADRRKAGKKQADDKRMLQALYAKNGRLSFRNALNNCVDTDTMIEVIRLFCAQAEDTAENILKAMEEERFGDYTIYVHSLKGVSRTIGALQMTEDARLLEAAGDEEDIDTIRAKTPQLIDDYRELTKTFLPLTQEE